MKQTGTVYTVAELDGSEKDVQKDAANIVKTWNVLEAMVIVSMAVCTVILDTDANKVLCEPSRKKTQNLGFRPVPTPTGLYNHR